MIINFDSKIYEYKIYIYMILFILYNINIYIWILEYLDNIWIIQNIKIKFANKKFKYTWIIFIFLATNIWIELLIWNVWII